MRALISVFLVWMLSVNSVDARPRVLSAFRGGSQSSATAKPTLKEQVLAIPVGSMVEVRLNSKEKFRGRLGEVSNEGFIVKYAQGNQIDERKVSYDDVMSIKSVEGSRAGRTALYVLAGAGVVFIVLFVISAVLLRNS
jgi:hypothetical protein